MSLTQLAPIHTRVHPGLLALILIEKTESESRAGTVLPMDTEPISAGFSSSVSRSSASLENDREG